MRHTPDESVLEERASRDECHQYPPGGYASDNAQPRRQRADAERNRRALLDAAVQVFGERGLDATVAEIAARAGVGQGTAFRHFPTKEQLIAATVRDMLDRITATALEQLQEPDPLLALRTLLHAARS